MVIEVNIENAEEGGYFAKITNIDDCIVTEGESWEETHKNIQEMVYGYLELLVELDTIPSIPEYDLHIIYKTHYDANAVAVA